VISDVEEFIMEIMLENGNESAILNDTNKLGIKRTL
jgi:hypothetical protein